MYLYIEICGVHCTCVQITVCDVHHNECASECTSPDPTAAVSTMEEDYTPLSSALKLLPKAHYLLLRYLGEHLHRVVDHSTDNLVTAHNLAVIMAPTLMRAPSDCTTIFKDVHLQQYFLECVIAKSDRLFS